MINRLYVFGNMGHLDQLPKSGGQTSARRVMKGFQEEGIEIIPIRRHRAELESKLGHICEVGYFAVYDLLKMIAKMIFRRRKNSAFMQMTYAGALVPYEYILSMTARLMGFKNMEYLQGGQVMDAYPKGGKLHKSLFKANMNLQSLVLFEGYDALKLVESITKKPELVYLPSYVRDEFIPEACPTKPTDEINICYFGRMSPTKNPLITLHVFEELCKRNPDKRFSLTLVGSDVVNPDYVAKLDAEINASPYRDHITRKENSPFEYLLQMMQKQHFFLFPTQEKAEGHSNALNEAMSQGLIPIVSDYHFNKTVVGDERLAVKGYNEQDYVEKIEWVINNCDLKELSEKMWRRVRDNFSYKLLNHDTSELIKTI